MFETLRRLINFLLGRDRDEPCGPKHRPEEREPEENKQDRAERPEDRPSTNWAERAERPGGGDWLKELLRSLPEEQKEQQKEQQKEHQVQEQSHGRGR